MLEIQQHFIALCAMVRSFRCVRILPPLPPADVSVWLSLPSGSTLNGSIWRAWSRGRQSEMQPQYLALKWCSRSTHFKFISVSIFSLLPSVYHLSLATDSADLSFPQHPLIGQVAGSRRRVFIRFHFVHNSPAHPSVHKYEGFAPGWKQAWDQGINWFRHIQTAARTLANLSASRNMLYVSIFHSWEFVPAHSAFIDGRNYSKQ